MKKLLLLFVACALTLLGHAQDAPIVVEGDLNKDGIMDRIEAALYNIDGTFSFYFGNADGDYTLFRSYETGLQDYGDVDISITDKGVVRIQVGFKGDCDVFLFRFQDDDFYLIGSKVDRHDSEHYDISHNYLTGKMVRTDGEGKEKKSVTEVMPLMPELRLSWFPLDFSALDYLFEENASDDPVEYKTIMGLYYLMMDGGFFSLEYCPDGNYCRPYSEPSENEDGSWSVYDESLKPWVSTSMLDVRFMKREDGAYHITVRDLYHDRSYEQYLEEDGMELEEAMALAEKEKGAPLTVIYESEWLFKDGAFIFLDEKVTNE